MKKKQKLTKNILMFSIIGILLFLLVVFILGNTSSGDSVKFRTSELVYNWVSDPHTSIAYSSIKGGELSPYCVVAYAPIVCEGRDDFSFLFQIPGILEGEQVSLYSDSSNENYLYVCGTTGAIRYSKESWCDDYTVELDKNSVDPSREA